MSSDPRLDKWIKQRIVELVESSPQPPEFPVATRSGARRTAFSARRSLIGITAVAALAGLIAVVGPRSSGGTAGASVLIDLHAPVGGTVTGRLPRSAVVNGRVDWRSAPNRIALVSATGAIEGYVRKAILDGTAGVIGPLNGGTFTPECGSQGIRVYNKTGTRVVGAYYPDAGFVPLGVSPRCIHVTPTTVLKRRR